MSRTDSASRFIAAAPERVYRAFINVDDLAVWLPPSGMHAVFERFDPRPGGGYRVVLTYDDASSAPGKADADTDVVEARFVELVDGARVVQAVDFESDDPAFAGTMTMTWAVCAEHDGSRVDIRAAEVPSGISAEDHIAGLTSSLDNLARFLAS